MSRTVNGEHLFQDVEKDMLVKQIYKTAEYCGIEVITCAAMINHFHITARVPRKAPLSDAELLRRYALLHTGTSKWQMTTAEGIKRILDEGGDKAAEWRQQQMAMMGDISPFMQLVKQRFSIWFNQTHNRFGTLWAERYKSTLLQDGSKVVLLSAVYTDLNAVRAGLVVDPKDYRHCGYARALAGDRVAQQGLCSLFPEMGWEEVQSKYRIVLFERAAKPRSKGCVIPQENADQVVAAEGKLPWGELLRFRARFLTDGAVLGSKAFVAEHLAIYRERTGRGQRSEPREVSGVAELAMMRNLPQAVPG